jgi:hypothetical protein
MAKQNDRTTRQKDTKQASTIIALFSLVGLTICFVAAGYQKVNVPIFLYAIFGGGVLGTDNVLKFIRTIFRIDR